MLKINNISYSVRQKIILQKVNCEIKKGEILAVIGPNGAGKSTLIKTISGECKAEGEVIWKGQNIKDYNSKTIAKQRAILTQQIGMSFDFPVSDIVLMGRYPHFKNKPTKGDIAIVQEAIQFAGIEHLVDRKYVNLSGGEKQRVQAARVFAQVIGENKDEPKLLLLDEPLNNLDVQHQHILLSRVEEFVAQGNVALIVMHDLNLASQFASKVLLLKEGKQLGFGLPEEIIKERTISECYCLDAKVCQHPFNNCPVVYFGCQKNKKTENLKSNELILN